MNRRPAIIPLGSLYTKLPSWQSWLKSTAPHTQKTLTTISSLSNPEKQKVIVISGPTGAGKSRLALELAKRLNGEIISADSVQVYRGLDIGSAKPTQQDQAQVAHHLLDIRHPAEEYSSGEFYRDARLATESVLQRGRVPIVTGGTGLYLRWYIYGKPGVPKATVEAAMSARSELDSLRTNKEWDRAVDIVIQAGDPTARSLPVNNWYRLHRKLEILKSSGGAPPSSFAVPYEQFCSDLDANDLDYEFICIFLTSPRVDLYRSIDYRCEEMLMDTSGLLTEASWLLDTGLKPNMNSATRAIGYRQAMEYLSTCRENNGKTSADEFNDFLSKFQKASRNFAKRQLTWCRNERIYRWVNGSCNFEEILGFVRKCHAEGGGTSEVPRGLEVAKEHDGKGGLVELMTYRTVNRLFVRNQDFDGVLDWIGRTQGRPSEAIV